MVFNSFMVQYMVSNHKKISVSRNHINPQTIEIQKAIFTSSIHSNHYFDQRISVNMTETIETNSKIKSDDKPILVRGAGLSGLSAATLLAKA
ncbi:MAG: hypothetical protein KAS04_06870, partial [Candidatus Aenigmarchaeota archaeon]|nr:hypothetical protein [Candidatus Aenigmarchaeota archaeon]